MSDFNSANNRAVWFDIPVADLDRAVKFYANVLAIGVSKEQFGDMSFGILDHADGNGGCLVPRSDEITSDRGILIYLNVNGRIRDAVAKVADNGGMVVEDTHPIGPHGYRAIVLDSEGNRMALHSVTDA
ncbi:MAG: hypothetical protein KDB27_15265 [Planctomycetales bacterium]|nr:hypothetical protein [Planctomycetales bacterium]